MSKRFKRNISTLLLGIMFISLFTSYLNPAIIAADDKPPASINGFDNKCGYNPVSDGKIPTNVKPCSDPTSEKSSGFKFNSSFYYKKKWGNLGDIERNLIVYGTPESVPKRVQDFKNGWQSAGPSTAVSNEGHFYVNDEYGEYRYLGFTQDGSLFSNVHFINDSNSGNALSSKHWVIDPWKDLPSGYKYKPKGPGAVYQDDDGKYESVMLAKFDKYRTNIARSIGFTTIKQGVDYASKYDVLPSSVSNNDPRNYMSIDQAPTTREGGFGNMYHFSWETNSLWYHTFALYKFAPSEKNELPNACVATPVNTKAIPLGKESKVKVQIKVTGSIDDKFVIGSDQGEARFYTRKDAAFWNLNVTNQSNQIQAISSSNKAHGIVVKENTASGIITLEIDTNKLDKSNPSVWKYNGTAGSVVYYNNHTSANPSFTTSSCNFVVNFKGNDTKGPMLSEFGVVPEIQFEKKSSFNKAQLGYHDFSYGKDVDYYTFEITNDEDKTKITRTFNPAIPEVKAPKAGYLDQDAVNTWLFNFIQSKFPSESVLTNTARVFTIKQTIVDKDSTINNTSVAMKMVTVVQVPELILGCGANHDMRPAPPQYITPQANWPLDWYDVVPFPVTDAAPELIPHKACEDPAGYNEFTKQVYIDGAEIDAADFFNGDYVFGEEATGIRAVTVTWTAPDGSVSHMTQHVVIHETKPRVAIQLEGLYKENRTMMAYDRSALSNDQWTEQNAPLEVTSFSYVNTSDPNLKCRTGYCEENLKEKMFMYKSVGIYEMSITAKRVITYDGGKTITRYSDPYVVEYEIQPDHRPAIIAHAYNSQISRLDELQLNYQVESTDGDFIAEKILKIYYDANNDGTFDTKVYETNGDITALPKFGKLGQYQIIVDAKEATNQDRLMEFTSPVDDRTHTSTAYFFIDNYEPSSDLYFDVPTEKPDMDVYFMLDSNLTQASSDYVNNNKVTITNAFTTGNMLANVGIWDMKTYTYEQPGSTSYNSGNSYPPSTISHTTAQGYSGTLPRTSVSNSPYSRDEGRYVSKTDSKTGTGTCTNTVVTSYGPTGAMTGQSSTSACPSSKPYSDGQYSGTISRTGETSSGSCPSTGGPKNGSCSVTWTAYYSGTVYWTRDVWEPKMVSYDNYTGFYSGTIYKDIRQPYDASFMRAVQAKYIVYISDNTVSQLSDLQNVMNKQSAKLILVGQAGIQSQIANDKYLANDKPIDQVITNVISYIAESNPAIPKVLKLMGEEIETRTATFDYEGDSTPAATDVMQIIQDQNYYDNSLGYDTFAGKTLTSTKLGTNWAPYQSKITLNKPGKYQFFRKIKDLPTTDPNFPGYDYYSNESMIEVFVHRKPIADVTLDFDYLTASNTYKTTWVDLSYDLDHNITRANTDRGIQDRTIKFTNQGTGEVFTKIPDSLPPGTYVLDYMAQDIEGVWSDPIQRTFVLPDTVPVQLKSNLKTAYSGFSLASVPASEGLIAHQLWTRYPYSISLAFSMGGYISRTVPYYTGAKIGNDISWNDEQFTIPSTTPDGLYTFSILASGSVAGSTAAHSYSVRVVTPINLSGQVDNSTGSATDLSSIVVNDTYSLKAKTTKYPNTTTVTVFKGTAYQKSVTLTSTTSSTTGYGQKDWTGSFAVGAMPNGFYTIEWRSTTPNGNVETVSKIVEVMNNRPPVSDFDWSPKPVYEGDTINLTNLSTDPDNDAMLYTWTITGPNGYYSKVFNTKDVVIPGSITSHHPGNYIVRLNTRDVRGLVDLTDTVKTVQVLDLSIQGQVNHTDRYEELRLAYNKSVSGNVNSPRTPDMFVAGEAFVLEATTTNTGTSATKAAKVLVIREPFDFGVLLSSKTKINWSGKMVDTSYNEKLPDGSYTFTFNATWSNGHQESVDVVIKIKGDTRIYLDIHRQETNT